MHDSSVKAVRKLKDTTGQYLWGAGINATNQQDSLLGYPLYSDPDMPVMAANAKSVLFGNFQYYWIRDVDGVAIQRLNELYAANGQVGFRAYHRTDGKLLNTAAVKYLANSAT
jgi:HK97 family phage major capsid protein